MAEQQTNLKIIDYAGRTVDLDKFVQRAREKANAWMDYQGLKGSQRTDFLNEINSRLLSIVEGTNSSNSKPTAVAVSAKPNKKSGKGGFDPVSNVDTFLNGIASVSTVGGTESKSKSGKLPFDKRNTMATLISNAIFGEGNGFSEEQLNAWADAKDPQKEGETRSTEGRRTFIGDILKQYRQDLENGKYDISDEDKANEISTIDSIRNNNLEQWELNKKAPWLSHLLFTDPKYYATEAARTAAENKAKEAQAQSYLNGSGENPYDKEKEKDKYNALETEKKKKADENFISQFDAYNIRSSKLAPEHWLPRWNTVDGNVFAGWNYDNNDSGVHKLIEALYQVNNDYSDDGRGLDINTTGWNLEMGHDDYTGWGKGDTSMKDLFPQAYFDYAHGNDDMPDDVTSLGVKGFTKGRSNNAFKGKFLSDWLNYIIKSPEGSKYRIGDGTQYIFPDLVDWNTGTAYVVKLGMDQRNTLYQINIADKLKEIKESNPDLYKELLNSYAKKKNYTFSHKEGGVIKAQFGAAMEKINTGNREKIDAQDQHIAQVGQEAFDRELASKSTRFTPLEMTRIGSTVADIGAAIAAWEPVYGTAASATLGLGSTAANLGADIFDKSVSSGQVLTNLGTNLAMDVVGLIPGWGAAGKGAKIAKTVAKLAPKLLTFYSLYNVGPEAYNATKKLVDKGPSEMTTEDWKNLAYGMSAVAGTSRIGAAAYHNRRINNSKPKGTPGKTAEVLGQEVQVKNSEGKLEPVKFTTEELKQINSQPDNAAATSKMRQILKDKGIEEVKADKYELPDGINIAPAGIKNLGGIKTKLLSGSEYTSEGTASVGPTRPEMIDWYARLQQQDLLNSNSWHAKAAKSLEAFLPKGKKFATNNEIYAQGESTFKNPLAEGFLARQMGQQRKGQAEDLGKQLDNFKYERPNRPSTKELQDAANKGNVERKNANAAVRKAQADLNDANAKATSVWETKDLKAFDKLLQRRTDLNKLHSDKAAEVADIQAKITDADAAYKVAERDLTNFTTTNKADKKGKYGNQAEYDRLKNQFNKAKQELDDLKIREATEKLKQDDLKKVLDKIEKQYNKQAELKKKFDDLLAGKKKAEDALKDVKAKADKLNKDFRDKNKAKKIVDAAKLREPDMKKWTDLEKKAYDLINTPELKAINARQDALAKVKAWRAAGRPTPNAEQRAALNEITRKGADIDTSVDYKGVLKDIKNDARFGAFIQDLADRGVGENQLKQILGNPQVLKLIREIYGFKEGGKFIPKGDIGSWWNRIKGYLFNEELAKEGKAKAQAQSRTPASTTTTNSRTNAGERVRGNNAAAKGSTISQAEATIRKNTRSQAEANPDKPTTVNPVTQNTPLQGQLGNLQGNLGSLTGTLGSTGTTGPKYEPITDEGYNGTDNVGSRWGSYGDLGLTGLELAKFLGSNYYNYLVRNKYKNLKPVHLINPLENYRIWSPKPLADQALKVRTEAAQLGDLAARGTNDLGTAFAHRITAWDRGQKAALPYDLQYNADIKESVNTGLGVINRNNQAVTTRVNGNHQADVAKYNQDQMADAQYYNHLGTQVQQLLGTMLRGVAMSNAADYENEYNNFMATDPSVLRAKNDYQAAYNAYTAIKDSGDTEAINKAYAAYNAAANRYNDVLTQKSTMWLNTHRAPLGVPFARPRRTAGYTAPFSFLDEFLFAKKGGVLEEKGRMHRHHDKLFYQSLKLLLTESNKKLRAMANGYGYLLKLMMLSK